jgi:hypothetical protein
MIISMHREAGAVRILLRKILGKEFGGLSFPKLAYFYSSPKIFSFFLSFATKYKLSNES